MPWQLSYGYHVWCLLELQHLVVGERALGMDNQIWVERTVLLLSLWLRGVTDSRKPAIRTSAQTTQAAGRINDLG